MTARKMAAAKCGRAHLDSKPLEEAQDVLRGLLVRLTLRPLRNTGRRMRVRQIEEATKGSERTRNNAAVRQFPRPSTQSRNASAPQHHTRSAGNKTNSTGRATTNKEEQLPHHRRRPRPRAKRPPRRRARRTRTPPAAAAPPQTRRLQNAHTDQFITQQH